MDLSAKAETAYLVWSHYQDALVSGVFKNEDHKKMVVEGEQLWRNKYLDATEDGAHIVMKNAGCAIIDNHNGNYCITAFLFFIMQINGSAFSCWILN